MITGRASMRAVGAGAVIVVALAACADRPSAPGRSGELRHPVGDYAVASAGGSFGFMPTRPASTPSATIVATVPHTGVAAGSPAPRRTATSVDDALRGPPVAAAFPGALVPRLAIVAEVQRLLTAVGVGLGAVDGQLNAATLQAIEAYQRDHGLAVDGRISGPLLAQLRADAFPRAAKAMGPVHAVGRGHAWPYIEFAPDGRPIAVGVVLSMALLSDLPAGDSASAQCFDLDLDRAVDPVGECVTEREVPLVLPDLTYDGELPIDWIAVNWRPHGRQTRVASVGPQYSVRWPAAWSVPHFGVHFLLPDFATVRAESGLGPCGDLIDCRTFARATMPLPAPYAPPNHVDVGGASAHFGNHLIDRTAPDVIMLSPDVFEHGFTYGSFDGALTFFEIMATPGYLLSRPDSCFAVSQPEAVARSGYYPTAYCLRHRPEVEGVSLSLEGLIGRAATAHVAASR